MRLLQLSQTLNRKMGGFATALYPLHGHILSSGHGSDLLGLDADLGDQESVPRLYSFEPHLLPRFYYSRSYGIQAEQFARECDSIHVHGLWVYPNLVAGQLSRKLHKPLVIHPHGMLEPWAMKRGVYKKSVMRMLFENQNFRDAALWRALTEAEAAQIKHYCPQANVVTLPNGIMAGDFEGPVSALDLTAKHPELFNKKWIVFLSRLHQKKGLDLLVKAWSKLHRDFPGWQLVIAGGDDGYGDILHQMIDSCDLRKRVTLLGLVHGNEKAALLKNAQLFVLPPRSEGFSMAVLEALAAGLPVLITHNCNFPEVDAVGAGKIVEASEPSIEEGLRNLLGLPEYYLDEMGQKGATLVREKYTWEKIASQMVGALEKL